MQEGNLKQCQSFNKKDSDVNNKYQYFIWCFKMKLKCKVITVLLKINDCHIHLKVYFLLN